MRSLHNFDFNDNARLAIPTLGTWLQSLKLETLAPALDKFGVVELVDLAVRVAWGSTGPVVS